MNYAFHFFEHIDRFLIQIQIIPNHLFMIIMHGRAFAIFPFACADRHFDSVIIACQRRLVHCWNAESCIAKSVSFTLINSSQLPTFVVTAGLPAAIASRIASGCLEILV